MAKVGKTTEGAGGEEVAQLGDRVRDRVTGFEGIVQCVAYWLNGCTMVDIKPERLTKDGDTIAGKVFDIVQVEVVKRGVHLPRVLGLVDVPAAPTTERTGGPERRLSERG